MGVEVKRGFTLIELLVTVGIIAILAGMLMPVLGVARRQGNITNTKVLLRKIDAALIVFRNEVGGFPYASDTASTNFSNHLGFTLCYDKAVAQARGTWVAAEAVAGGTLMAQRKALVREQGKAFSDAHAATLAYDPVNGLASTRYYSATINSIVITETNKQHYQPTDIRTEPTTSFNQHVMTLSRMAMERARVGIMCGNTAVKSCVWVAASSKWDQAGVELVSASVQRDPANPTYTGWVGDYLLGELTGRDRDPADPNVFIDAFGQSINYQCTIIPGAAAGFTNVPNEGGAGPLRGVQPDWYALEPRSGRVEAVQRSSDRRVSAAISRIWTFELWSDGPDGKTHYMRDDRSCTDDVSLISYTEGLQ